MCNLPHIAEIHKSERKSSRGARSMVNIYDSEEDQSVFKINNQNNWLCTDAFNKSCKTAYSFIYILFIISYV